MAIEQLRSDTLSADRAEVVYLLTDQASTTAAKALLISDADATVNGLPRLLRSFSVTEEESEDGAYIGRAVYGTSGGSAASADLQVGDTRILISSLGGSVHITQTLNTEHTHGLAVDFGGAIGVASDGAVRGTDIITGGLDITIIKIVDSTDLDTTYLASLLALSSPNPHTNDATFAHTDTDGRSISLAAGEALFLGFTNTPRGNGEDELRFNFKGAQNLSDAVPSTPWTIVKEGWEHVWIHYTDTVDAVANALAPEPLSAYVEQVYEEGDFTDLAL